MTTITPGLVRHYRIEVAPYTDGTDPTTWTKVGGLKEYTPLANEKGRQDDSEFDSDGRQTEIGTTIKSEISGKVKISEDGPDADPGQAILNAAGGKLGSDGFVHYREYHVITGKGYEGIADASYNPTGGSQDALTEAEFTLAVRSVEPYTVTP